MIQIHIFNIVIDKSNYKNNIKSATREKGTSKQNKELLRCKFWALAPQQQGYAKLVRVVQSF